MRRRSLLHALSVAAMAASFGSQPVYANGGPPGIGFVQAEEGTWWCNASGAAAALDCAMKKCDAESGGQECHATRWCFPAGWSALMVVWLPEFHSTHVLCGMPGEQAARAAMQAICNAGDEFTRCDLVLFIDPDGTQSDPVGVSWPGHAAGKAPSP